jgi:chromatin remodeling complex protein RSC6
MTGWKGKTQLLITPDENLSKIIGSKPLIPSQITKNLWIYMKKNCKSEKVKL